MFVVCPFLPLYGQPEFRTSTRANKFIIDEIIVILQLFSVTLIKTDVTKRAQYYGRLVTEIVRNFVMLQNLFLVILIKFLLEVSSTGSYIPSTTYY